MKRWALFVALVIGAARCTCGVPGVGDDTYACKTDEECLSSYVCLSGRCRPKGSTPCPTVDCSDSACDGRSCAANGKVCANQTCSCSGNGGAVQTSEAACGDGHDNDCNGQTDCQDPACDTLACGSGGTCVNRVCVCPAAGGMPQAVESACTDGLDNDCDGLTDCADPSCGNIGCGLNGKVCTADAGACQCGGNGGLREGSESSCADLADNDCDGLTDCADDTCAGQTCRPNGWRCMSMVCTCTGNGGTPEAASETSCTDGFDNDCDGLVDCADPSCAGQSCGMGCSCSTGAKRETACTDGMDNDGDGATDCADSDCAGVSCGANGLACSAGACTCVVDGGVAQQTEQSCGDSRDNDCDGLTDCSDSDCAGQSCGSNRLCVGQTCTCSVDGGATEPTEQTCNDGLDNDCDGLTDCNDPDCQHRQCGASTAFVCCGNSCKNLSSDAMNCGGCGLTCSMGCSAITVGGIITGHCACNNANQCNGAANQSCSSSFCTCANNSAHCAAGETCMTNACVYP